MPRSPPAGPAAAVVLAAGVAFAAEPRPWWRDAVCYQVFVRSFADSETGPLAGDGIGDLQGLIDRLDYLNDGDPAGGADLGVDALWLLPIHPSPSYHGYDVVDYRDVNPDYGSLDLFKRFLAEAHRRGIRVLIDLVLNHTSSRHPWFQHSIREDAESPYRDYYRFAPERVNGAGPWGEPCWHDRNGEYYYGVFSSGMPDLNFRHPPVTAYFRDVARFWLDEVGVDGFRLDAVRFYFEDGASLQDLDETKAWLRAFRAFCKSVRPDCFLVGEVWSDTGQAASYVAGGSLDAAFEFDLAEAMIATANFGAPRVHQQRMERVRSAFGSHAWAAFLANHDQMRTMTQLGGHPGKAAVAAALLLSDPGIPFIYYGEEIGMSGNKPDPRLRTPMQWSDAEHAGFSTARPWQALNQDVASANVRDQLADPASLLNYYRRMIALRRSHPEIARGTPVECCVEGRGVMAILRRTPDRQVLVLLNLREFPRDQYTLLFPAADPSVVAEALEVLHGKELAAKAGFRDGLLAWQPVDTLPPLSAFVIMLPPSSVPGDG